MKRLFYICAFVGVALLALTGCESKNPPQPTPQPEDTLPASYPKKHLIEEFTGQSCGYCPYGMDCIQEFINNDSNFITILHHYGYSPDKFSVKGSEDITKALQVKGAPGMCINRDYTIHKDEYGKDKEEIVFHPGYLEGTDRSQLETATFASIRIQNTYDPATKELKIDVNGNVLLDEPPTIMLTVLVKESGMIDTQADYYKTFSGWKEFRHVNAVRTYLSAPKGDTISITNKGYSASYSLQMSDKWVAENCMVVAFLAEGFKPIIQAEQAPVVSGTKGGADIVHGGITPVPVPDYYPEIDATSGPSTFSSNREETIETAGAYYASYPDYGVTYWMIQAYTQDASVSVNNTICVPFTEIYFFTDVNTPVNSVPTGTFSFLNTNAPGTAEAGYRDDERFEIGGSMFYFVNKTSLGQGYIDPIARWFIADGTLTITRDGWSVIGHARNGARIKLTGSSAIQYGGRMNSPVRKAPKKTRAIEYCK